MADNKLMQYPLGFSDLLEAEKSVVTLFRFWRQPENAQRKLEPSKADERSDHPLASVMFELFTAFRWIDAKLAEVFECGTQDVTYQLQRNDEMLAAVLSKAEEFMLECLATHSIGGETDSRRRVSLAAPLQECRKCLERSRIAIRCPHSIERTGRDHLLRRISDSYHILGFDSNAATDINSRES